MTRRSGRPPASALALLQQEVNDLFQRLTLLDRSEHLPGSEWCPPVDVYETRGRLVVVVEVPGLPPESLKVAFRDHSLVLAGTRRTPRPGPGVSFQCLERPDGRFERVLPLEIPVDVARARARLDGGLLTVTLPRLHERRGRETIIPIEKERDE
ncbi:MAG: Hsp20/alpha crystallin family protein [Acidobacteria bacterium]|nr:Hsp20/alpha crystallin family protein [Acidobacteriota bacterium]